MSDGVLIGEVVAVAKDVAVVRVQSNGESILGICRLATATTNPSGLWFQDIQGRELPLIGRFTDQELIIEPILDGTPLIISVQRHIGRFMGTAGDYPWVTWATTTPPQSWHGKLFHTTHFLVGAVCVIALIICLAARRRAVVQPDDTNSGGMVGRITRRAFGGWLGLGKDSFSSLPMSQKPEEKR